MSRNVSNATKDHSRVTPEGRAAGAFLVRIVEPLMAEMVAGGDTDDRCKSCAFRAGTVPNGCLQTQLDAAKAMLEQIPFACHVHKNARGEPALCAGWLASQWGSAKRPTVKCPWEFSQPDEAENHQTAVQPHHESTADYNPGCMGGGG